MSKEEKIEETKIEEKVAVPDCFGVLFDDGNDCRACKIYEDCKEAAVKDKIAEEAPAAEDAPIVKDDADRVPDKADIEDPDSGLLPVAADKTEETPAAEKKTKRTRKKSIMLDIAFFKIDGNKSEWVDKEKDATLILRKGNKVRVNNKRSKFHGKEAEFTRYSVNWNECPLDLGGKFKTNIKPQHLEVVND